MRKTLCILSFVAALFMSCNKPDDGGGTTPSPSPSPSPTPTPTESLELASGTDTDPVLKSDGGTINVKFTASVAWTASLLNSNASGWVSISPSSGSAGTSTIGITVKSNDSTDDRSATVQLKAGSKTANINVTQKQKDALTVTASRFEVSKEGGDISVELSTNTSFTYTIEGDAAKWISYVSTKAMSSKTLMFNVAANEFVKKRSGVITLTASGITEHIDVYQDGETPSLVLSQNDLTISAEGDEFVVDVTSNVDVSYTVSCDWIQLSTSKSTSTNSYRFIVSENTGADSRTTELVFYNEEYSLSEKVTVTQITSYVHVGSVYLDYADITLTEGDEQTLTATVLPENASNKNLIWRSNNENVVTVKDGVVKAITPGYAYVTVETEDGGYAAGCNVNVNELPKVEFWDDAFKAYCVKNFDTDGDGQISYKEAEQVTEISYSFTGSSSIWGIQAFTNLQTLKLSSDCNDLNDIWNDHYVWDIDPIYELKKLIHIEFNWLGLSSFDFGRLTELEYIDCSNCAFQNLDVSNLKKLAYLDCSPMAYDNLQTLTIYDGQEIPNVTVNRNSDYIPDRTIILSPGKVDGSGNEGTEEGDEI